VQQFRVEDLFLGGGVHLEKRGEPRPDSTQSRGVGAVDLFQDREQPPLLMVVIEDQLGDVHGSPIWTVSDTISSTARHDAVTGVTSSTRTAHIVREMTWFRVCSASAETKAGVWMGLRC
jgi:hypothetical protein